MPSATLRYSYGTSVTAPPDSSGRGQVRVGDVRLQPDRDIRRTVAAAKRDLVQYAEAMARAYGVEMDTLRHHIRVAQAELDAIRRSMEAAPRGGS